MAQAVLKPVTAETMHTDDTIYTVSEVAKQLNLHANVVRRWIYAGQLQAFYVGGRRLRITQRHLEQFLQTYARPT